MIKTNTGIYLEPKTDIPYILNSSYFIPIATKNLLKDLYFYYLSEGNKNSIILLKEGTILENLYLAALEKEIMKEQKFSFNPQTILLWNDYTEDNIRKKSKQCQKINVVNR